jgi:hypothetical protein
MTFFRTVTFNGMAQFPTQHSFQLFQRKDNNDIHFIKSIIIHGSCCVCIMCVFSSYIYI